MIVVDASVLLAAEDSGDPHHRAALAVLRSAESLATIDLAAYEVTNVAAVRWRNAAAGRRLRERVWAIADYGRLVRLDALLAEDSARLAAEHEISAYDAAYVAAAQRLACPLLSCDERDLVSRGLARLPAA